MTNLDQHAANIQSTLNAGCKQATFDEVYIFDILLSSDSQDLHRFREWLEEEGIYSVQGDGYVHYEKFIELRTR